MTQKNEQIQLDIGPEFQTLGRLIIMVQYALVLAGVMANLNWSNLV